jgi:hypothetical protein
MLCIVLSMDPNACSRCGRPLFANRTCRCGWPEAKARTTRMRVAMLRPRSGKNCDVLACRSLADVGKLCWRHYRHLRKQVPADRKKGLGCYRGMPRKLIRELASIRRASIHGTKERLFRARLLIFEAAGGRIMKLPRKQRQFVNRVSHESYEIYLVRCLERKKPPMSFKAFRRRWYGAQKANWRRFDVPRMMSTNLKPPP